MRDECAGLTQINSGRVQPEVRADTITYPFYDIDARAWAVQRRGTRTGVADGSTDVVLELNHVRRASRLGVHARPALQLGEARAVLMIWGRSWHARQSDIDASA